MYIYFVYNIDKVCHISEYKFSIIIYNFIVKVIILTTYSNKGKKNKYFTFHIILC